MGATQCAFLDPDLFLVANFFCERADDDDGDLIRSESEIEDVVARARIWMKTRLDAIMVIDHEISDISDLTRECVSDVIGRAELQITP